MKVFTNLESAWVWATIKPITLNGIKLWGENHLFYQFVIKSSIRAAELFERKLCIPLSLVSHLNLQSKIIVDVDILQVQFSFPDNDVSRNWKYFQPIIAYKKHQEMTFFSLSHNGVTLDADRNISTAILLVFIRQWGRLFTCRYLQWGT